MLTDPWFWLASGLSVPVYWSLPRTARAWFLSAISLVYLAWLAPQATIAVWIWSLTFFYTLRLPRPRRGRLPLLLVLAIIGWLALFKYVPVIAAGWFAGSSLAAISLPLGISYYTFKLIHYAVETQRDEIPAHELPDFLSYVFLVPTFTAGPIERFDHYLSNREAEWHGSSLAAGATRLMHGLVKKFVFVPALQLFQPPPAASEFVAFPNFAELTALGAWRHLAFAYLVIYVDFSAYSDIAIGFSRLYGLTIMENFNFPVLARSPVDFWRRWHISLSNWCLTYVYMPALGLYRRRLPAIGLAFLVMGTWHSLSSNRLGWACYHVAGLTAYNAWVQFKRRRKLKLLPAPLGDALALAATQCFIIGGAAFLVGPEQRSVAQSLRLLVALVGLAPEPRP